jgi:hypothetical protein
MEECGLESVIVELPGRRGPLYRRHSQPCQACVAVLDCEIDAVNGSL